MKPGDVVVCLTAEYSSEKLSEGNVYVVDSVIPISGETLFGLEESIKTLTGPWYASRFIKIGTL